MLRISVIYFAIAGGTVGYLIWQATGQYGGANHWIYFGTKLDQFIQQTGFGTVPFLMASLVLACMFFIFAGQHKSGLAAAILALCLAYLTWRLIFIALD